MAAGKVSTRWVVSFGIGTLVVCAGIVALCFFRDRDPSRASSGSALTSDPCEGTSADERAARVVLTVGPSLSDSNEEASVDAAGTTEGSGLTESLASPALAGPPADTPTLPATGLTLSGQLIYQDGTPYRETIGLAEVLRVHVTAEDTQRVCELADEGRFECKGLDAGPYTVSVVDALARRRIVCEAAQVELLPDAAFTEVILVLGQDVPVTVRVLDEQTLAAIADRTVSIQPMDGSVELNSATDAQGLCEFSLIGGRYRCFMAQFQDGRSVEVASKLFLVRPADGAVTVDLLVPSLDAGKGMIRGVFVDAAGNPVEGYVMLEHTPHETSGEVGTSFAVHEPDRQPPEGLLGYARDTSGLLGRRFLWPQGGRDAELTLVLEPHTSIMGQIVGVDRKPIPDVTLDLQLEMLDGSWRGADDALDTPLVDSEGYFTFDRIPIGVKVRVAAHRGTLSGQSHRLTLKPGELVDAGQIVMTGRPPGSGTIEGRVTDETGESYADRAIRVQVGRQTQWLRTNGGGYFTLSDMPEGQPVTVTIEVDPYGSWSRTAVPDDYACDFQLLPQGWGVVGEEAPPLFAGKWFNHAPLTMEQLRGRVVLLAFRNLDRDADPGLARLRNLQNEFGSQGLQVIAVYNHLPTTTQLAEDVVAEHLQGLLQGAPIAGLLDADPAVVADLMPAERPAGANGGATHWMYQVHRRPVFFLIDKTGTVRRCTDKDTELRDRVQRLLGE